MSAQAAGYLLLVLAVALIVYGAPQAALVVAIAAGGVAVFGAPTPAQRDATRRNQARRVR